MNEEIKKLNELADQWIREHKEELIEEIRGMVRIPSVSKEWEAEENAPFGPECRRMIDYFLERGRAFGFQTRDAHGYAGVISWGNPEEQIGIIAHLDVVPVGDGWVYPPFEATYLPEEDALIGRGVDDDKGPAVMGLYLMRMLRDLEIPMKHGIALYGGTSEETGMEDMAQLVKLGEKFPKLSLIPDAGFPVNYAQKGNLNVWLKAPAAGNLKDFRAGSAFNIIPDYAEAIVDLPLAEAKSAIETLPEELKKTIDISEAEGGVRIAANGVSGHAAFPDGSVNAVGLLSETLTKAGILTGSAKDAVAGLAVLTEDAYLLSEKADYSDEESGKTTLVYSMVKLEDGFLKVAGDSRYSISYDGEVLKEKLAKAWNGLGYEIESIKDYLPFYIPKDDPRVTTLQEIYKEVTGRGEEPYAMGGGTYSRVVPNAISFGNGMPGSRHPDFLPEGHGGAHGRDEVLLLDTFMESMKIYFISLVMLDRIL